MKTIQSIQALKSLLDTLRKERKTIGLVPTMGALHPGHLSLVKQSRAENDVTVVSIFVNPTQFNNQQDLQTYPRTLEADCRLLEAAGCDLVFAPSETEMYPEKDIRVFDLGAVAKVMEGKFRPGHFNGVAQVVSKLFYIVEPDRAYFGEKDFQQIAVIRRMVQLLNLPVEIRTCPIIREKDGLALSSRNTRLTAGQRQIAPRIAATLKESVTFAKGKSVKEVIDFVVDTLNRQPGLEVEYYEIVDGSTLQPIEKWEESTEPVGCIAIYSGDVRLIDNIKYKRITT